MEKNILIVDDEGFMRRLYSRIIQSSGKFKEYKLNFANDGSTAIEFLEQNDCEAVITDYHMAHKNGDEIYYWSAEKRPAQINKIIYVATLASEESQDFIEKYHPRFVDKGERDFNDNLIGNLEEILQSE